MSNTKKHRPILVVDDHPLLQLGVKGVVEMVSPLHEIHTAGTMNEVLERISHNRYDLIVSDLNLPDAEGVEVIEAISKATKSPILVYSLKEELLMGPYCFKLGAKGYVMKEASTTSLRDAIDAVLSGDVWCSKRLGNHLALGMANFGKKNVAGVESLTKREKEVFEALGRGYSIKEIAEMLEIRVKTVESHRDNIREKLDIDSTHELIVLACEWL